MSGKDHGKLRALYRIVNDGGDDVDLTRAQAIELLRQLKVALHPPPLPHVRPSKRKG